VRRGSGEAVRETSFAGQALEAVLKFRAYSWMCLANLVVGRAPGVEVEGWTVNSGKTGLPYFQVSHLGWKIKVGHRARNSTSENSIMPLEGAKLVIRFYYEYSSYYI
jgi:hypothetical protein